MTRYVEKKKGQKRDTYKGVRVSPASYDLIKKGAAAKGVSLLAYIERIVAEAAADADA